MSDSYDEIMNQEAEAEFWENLPKQLHEESVGSYLGVYGDAIEARITGLINMANALLESGFWGASLTVSATAIEVMIGYFCVRPMVEGAFLSDLWAQCLARWVVKTRPVEQRQILVGILRLSDIEIEKIVLADKQPLWETIQVRVLKKRNCFVHRGDDVSKEDAELGISCAASFRREVVFRIAERLGFSLPETGCWAHVVYGSTGPGHSRGERHFSARDPFSQMMR
jgi:hypothetical protein